MLILVSQEHLCRQTFLILGAGRRIGLRELVVEIGSVDWRQRVAAVRDSCRIVDRGIRRFRTDHSRCDPWPVDGEEVAGASLYAVLGTRHEESFELTGANQNV